MKKTGIVLLTFCLALAAQPLAVCGDDGAPQAVTDVTPGQQTGQEDAGGGLSDIWKKKMEEHSGGSREGTPEASPDGPDVPAKEDSPKNETPQLTADDIERMNHGDVTMLFSDEGYLTFLRGKYYDRKVTNAEEGIESLFGVAQLLGLTRGSEFFGVYAETNRRGYTYYIYKQRYGNITIKNAVLKVIVDPEGYTAGLVSSFTPELGFAPEDEPSITPEEAIESVQKHYPEYSFRFYPEQTRQTSVTIGGVACHAWAVFTDIPPEAGLMEGRSYLEHLIGYDGSYLTYMAVSSVEEMVLGDNVQEDMALAWFDGKTEGTYSGTVTLHDGSTKEITVPVVQDENGVYYLADLKRHILLSDCLQYLTDHTYQPFTSDDNTGWPEHYLLTYDTYIKVYDFYDSFGMTSVDGFGMPLLILTDYCDKLGRPVDNACFLGIQAGWALFAASAVNDYGESVDVIGHEFTHGVTNYTLAGDLYENESGAVNEALSDIMGNLCEMMLGETTDTQWLLGETSGHTVRSMSFPWLYRQPVTVCGDFYQEMTAQPTLQNDLGGVHTNSSLVAHLAWQLCAGGMSMEDAFLLWRETTNLLTPCSGFREVHHALIFAAEICGMDVEWMGMIDMLCEEAGF